MVFHVGGVACVVSGVRTTTIIVVITNGGVVTSESGYTPTVVPVLYSSTSGFSPTDSGGRIVGCLYGRNDRAYHARAGHITPSGVMHPLGLHTKCNRGVFPLPSGGGSESSRGPLAAYY